MIFWEWFWFLAVWISVAWYVVLVVFLGALGARDMFALLRSIQEEEP